MSDLNLRVTLDSIVFGLQRYGGISNYWGRLVRDLASRPSVTTKIIQPKTVKYVEYNHKLYDRSTVVEENIPTKVSRYLNVGNVGECDVFHSSYYRVPTRNSVRQVVTVHDFMYERYERGLARWVHSKQKLKSIAYAEDIICISNATRADLLHYAPSIDTSKVHVIYHGVDLNTYFPEPEMGEEQEKLSDMALYVGQRGGYKRFDLAVDAITALPGLLLGIVGAPLSTAEIALLDVRLKNRWQFFGPVSNSRLRQLYSSVLAFIFPSDFEGFGLPILEAMACGCPVVAAHTSSLPEVGGEVAVYAPEQRADMFAAGISRLRDSVVDRQSVIDAGLQHVKKFTWESTFDATLAVYQGKAS